MPIALNVARERVFSGTKRRIFQLLTDMGTSADAVWPYASQPFMRTPGPLTEGRTEEWHSGLHAVLAEVVPEERIVWRIDNEGVDGTHGFYLDSVDKKTRIVRHRGPHALAPYRGRPRADDRGALRQDRPRPQAVGRPAQTDPLPALAGV
jgi:hypothetical protein